MNRLAAARARAAATEAWRREREALLAAALDLLAAGRPPADVFDELQPGAERGT